jgi:hypothetical protein
LSNNGTASGDSGLKTAAGGNPITGIELDGHINALEGEGGSSRACNGRQ